MDSLSLPGGGDGARSAADRALCVAIGAATFLYLWLWPRDFFAFDEGLYLYESRRLLEGAVFYRDMLEIITPGSFYAMALLFRVFGVSLLTAKMGMAAVHAAIGILVFVCCRRAGARRSLALTAAAAHLAYCFRGLPIASPHWFGTLLMLVIVYAIVALPWLRPGRGPLLVGLANGGLVMVQQQKGAVIAAGVCCVLVADHLLARKKSSLPLSSLAARLALFAGGIAIVAVPTTLALLAQAGFAPMWESLIHFPLHNYPGFRQCGRWGFAGSLSPRGAWLPRFLAYLPLLAALLPVRLAWARLARGSAADARPAAALSLLLAAGALSVSYCPNITHLVLIAPIGFILLAETIERPLGALGARFRFVSAVVAVAAVAAIFGLASFARTTLERRGALYTIRHQTEVGPVDFRSADEITLLEAILERTDPGDEMFAYPTYPGIYFLTGTINPTRFQILLRDYHEPRHFQEAIDVLEARRTPLVAVQSFLVAWKTDPVAMYLARAYQRIPLKIPPGGKPRRLFSFALFFRRFAP